MKTVYRHPLYDFIHDEENNILIFDWTEETSNMTDDNFKEALSNYAGFAFEFGGPGLMVDVRKFQHNIGEEASKWRNEECLHRYLAAGSNKMGYVMPAPALDRVPKGDVAIGEFTDHYFASREEATSWLSN